MKKKIPEIVDTRYNPITRVYEVVDSKSNKDKPTESKSARNLVIAFGIVALVMVVIHLVIQVRSINDTAWRLGCMDGGVSPQKCKEVQQQKETQK